MAGAVKSHANVAAFDRMFPGADHSISYFSGKHGQPKWNSKALLHGRYVLTMQFDVKVDPSGASVTALSAPALHLNEVTTVTTFPSGQVSISYDPASARELGAQEWDALKASGGDLSSVGVKVKRDRPVEGLSVHWRGA